MELASFVSLVRTTVPARLDPVAEVPLIERLAETARLANDAATADTAPMQPVRATAWRPRLALAAKVAVAVALLPAATAGLAFAGVSLPEPAREAMERIGLDLPNQSAVDEPATTEPDQATDSKGERSRDGRHRAARANRADGGGGQTGGGKPGGRGRHAGTERGGGRPDQGESRGSGDPQLGEPAPIVPPGQGGTPPGQGGPSPSEGSGQSSEPHGAAPPSAAPPGEISPGQAKKLD